MRAVSSPRACDPVAGREEECGNHSRLKAKISYSQILCSRDDESATSEGDDVYKYDDIINA